MAEQAELGQLEVYRGAVVDFMERNRRYLGQMDLNIRSPLVWKFYKNTLQTLAGYGAKIVRLDAFAYAPKEPGARNFLNDPGTWELLGKVTDLGKTAGYHAFAGDTCQLCGGNIPHDCRKRVYGV